MTIGDTALRRRDAAGWPVVENDPAQPRRRVLMLPGLFCSSAFFTDVLADEALATAGVAALAADPPGFAGRPAPDGFDYSIASYAALVEEFAAAEAIDLIVGHSFSANVAIEIAARGNFRGKLLLLSPSLSREDEEDDLRSLDEASHTPVVGTLVWLGINPTLKHGMRGRLPEARFDELMAEMKRNPRAANRAQVVGFFEHMAAHGGELASRLATASTPVWLGRGDRDEVGITDAELAILDAAPQVTLKTIPGAAHFSITDAPHAVAQLVLDLLDDGEG
ncbi:alpha/beta hydrolase [Conexibacter stalactiti]|uniref:Alpha/beta hydrolase n=1 Tax=Conexibacter stalactiti TaxID=1940611 RepID=A0ABU4HUF4_9ACTN|nr:alpha/beta hydrolase [Conexibacter stalactiti]MDW5596967.1 alpha/beta hydrolase [Conexibacter stalactiti]MEC5037609.1 alpha/beta hydrolase [Conexibacter stalactiti]